jgi:hypothetical protein
LCALRGKEILQQFVRLLELSGVGLVADFEDRIGQQLPAFSCRLRACVEQIQ